MKQSEINREQAAALAAKLTPEEKHGLLTTHQHAAERLGLGEFYVGTEVARGFVGRREEDFSTVFPQPVGLASTFDRDLLRQLGDIAGTECRAYYNRDQRSALCVWGRRLILSVIRAGAEPRRHTARIRSLQVS